MSAEQVLNVTLESCEIGNVRARLPRGEWKVSQAGAIDAIGVVVSAPDALAVRLDRVPTAELRFGLDSLLGAAVGDDSSAAGFEILAKRLRTGDDGQEHALLSYVVERQGRLLVAVRALVGRTESAALQVMLPEAAQDRYEELVTEILETLSIDEGQ